MPTLEEMQASTTVWEGILVGKPAAMAASRAMLLVLTSWMTGSKGRREGGREGGKERRREGGRGEWRCIFQSLQGIYPCEITIISLR